MGIELPWVSVDDVLESLLSAENSLSPLGVCLDEAVP